MIFKSPKSRSNSSKRAPFRRRAKSPSPGNQNSWIFTWGRMERREWQSICRWGFSVRSHTSTNKTLPKCSRWMRSPCSWASIRTMSASTPKEGRTSCRWVQSCCCCWKSTKPCRECPKLNPSTWTSSLRTSWSMGAKMWDWSTLGNRCIRNCLWALSPECRSLTVPLSFSQDTNLVPTVAIPTVWEPWSLNWYLMRCRKCWLQRGRKSCPRIKALRAIDWCFDFSHRNYPMEQSKA